MAICHCAVNVYERASGPQSGRGLAAAAIPPVYQQHKKLTRIKSECLGLTAVMSFPPFESTLQLQRYHVHILPMKRHLDQKSPRTFEQSVQCWQRCLQIQSGFPYLEFFLSWEKNEREDFPGFRCKYCSVF